MSSIWLVVSGRDVPVDGEGFHVSEADAKARAVQKQAEDRAAYDRVKEWFEVSFDEFRAVRGLPRAYTVLRVDDEVFEIHNGGSVPDAVWVLLEEGEVDPEFGYRVTREGADDMLLNRDIAAWEYWDLSTERAEGMSFTEYSEECFTSRCLQRIVRHDSMVVLDRPSEFALRTKAHLLSDSRIQEPRMSVRADTTTFSWDGSDGCLVEVRVGSGGITLTVHRDNRRPQVSRNPDDLPGNVLRELRFGGRNPEGCDSK